MSGCWQTFGLIFHSCKIHTHQGVVNSACQSSKAYSIEYVYCYITTKQLLVHGIRHMFTEVLLSNIISNSYNNLPMLGIAKNAWDASLNQFFIELCKLKLNAVTI